MRPSERSFDNLAYRVSSREPEDLDAFWAQALAEARNAATEPSFTPYGDDVYERLEIDDVVFSGAGGAPIAGWLLRPRGVAEPLPCVVWFVGYGGGRGYPCDRTHYPAAGLALFVMDNRGQGGWMSPGTTGDPEAGSAWPERPGFMTRGVLDPRTYYYRRLYVDAVRAVETAAVHPAIDAGRIAVGGASQGGGIALAAAALAPELVAICHADLPLLCDFERALTAATIGPYRELVEFLAVQPALAPQVFRTLAYVDCAHLARRIRAATLVSAGGEDTTCPPSTVLAAYNAIEAPKHIELYEFTGHGVPPVQVERSLRHLRDVFRAAGERVEVAR